MTSNKGKGTNNRLATAALWYYATEVCGTSGILYTYINSTMTGPNLS